MVTGPPPPLPRRTLPPRDWAEPESVLPIGNIPEPAPTNGWHDEPVPEPLDDYQAEMPPMGGTGEREPTGSIPDDERDPAVDLHLLRLRKRLLATADLIDLPAPEPLIEGVLVKNTLAVLWGKPGSGKSFVAVDWAMSLGSSSWWFGHAVPAEWSRVLYLAGEGGAGLGQRADAWMVDRNVCTAPNVTWLPGSVNLLDRKWSEAMVALAVELDPVLVVVDTLARAMSGGDENSARDMGMLIDTAGAIISATTATVLLAHHDVKAGGTMRGSSALLGAADTSIECRADGAAITLINEKQKDGRQFEPIRLWREEVSDSCVIRSHSGVGPSGELTAAQETLRRVAWDCCGTDGLPPSELMRTAEQAHGTFYPEPKSAGHSG